MTKTDKTTPCGALMRLVLASLLLVAANGVHAVPITGEELFPSAPGWTPLSTNAANYAGDLPHVLFESSTVGEITLQFVNATNSLAFFEYRTDGDATGATPGHLVLGPSALTYDGVCVDGRSVPVCSAGPAFRTFTANSTVEVRLALGGERDWDFDWVTFRVAEVPEPATLGLMGIALVGFASRRKVRQPA